MEPEVRSPQERKFLLETIIFRFHVKFRGSNPLFHDFLVDVLLTEAQLQAAREKQIIKVWWTGCFWCGHGKKLLGLEETCPFALRIIGPSYRGTWTCIAGFRDLQTTSFEIPRFLGWGFIYDKVFSFLFLLGFFLAPGVFFTWTQNNDFFFEFTVVDIFGKDWRIGWLVGGWEFEVGIPGELQLIIPLLKNILFSPLGKWLKWSNLTIIFFSWVVQVKIVRVRCPLTATNPRDRFFSFSFRRSWPMRPGVMGSDWG